MLKKLLGPVGNHLFLPEWKGREMVAFKRNDPEGGRGETAFPSFQLQTGICSPEAQVT